MATIVSVDGEVVAPGDATISIFDRGFLYGDSVYEVVRTYDGVPFALEAHLDRLAGSAERLCMPLPVPLAQLGEEAKTTHQASGNPDSYLRIVVTRGSGPIGLDPALAEDQRRFVIAKDVKDVAPDATIYDTGAKAALVSVRRNLRSAIDPAAKTGNYLNSVMALTEARARGAYEAIMLDHRDYVTEGASSNIFVVVEGIVLTPPLAAGILAGVTRSTILEAAHAAGIAVLELPLTADVFDKADEAFITSSIREIVPIVQVDEKVVGSGVPGPMTKNIRQLFDAYVENYVASRRN